jgi:hypothetical protein
MIIDTPHRTTAKVTNLKNAGVKTIIRYYNHQNSSALPNKCLTAGEAQAIHGAGMTIAVTFQQRQNQSADFNKTKGRAAGGRALDLAINTINQPEDSAIYFSVDRDFISVADLNKVDKFFEGVNETFADAGASHVIGAYGSGKVLDRLRTAGLAKFFWLAQSTGWSGFQAFKNSGRWHLLQGPETTVQTIDCDTNQSNPAKPDFGAF